MITEALVHFVGQSLRAVLGLIPTWNPPVDPFTGSAYAVGGMAGALNGYFPVSTILVCLTLLVGLKVALLGWRLIVFVYHQVWGSD